MHVKLARSIRYIHCSRDVERDVATPRRAYNHLDMQSVDALADALKEFDGGVLFVTHDRSLVRRVATKVLEIKDGGSVRAVSPQDYLASLRFCGRTKGERK